MYMHCHFIDLRVYGLVNKIAVMLSQLPKILEKERNNWTEEQIRVFDDN